MPSWIDGSLYPDQEVPEDLADLGDKVDFLARLCGAWDFGILPLEETVAEIRRESWRDAVDACRLLTSPAYHLLRQWHRLPNLSYLGEPILYMRDDPNLEFVRPPAVFSFSFRSGGLFSRWLRTAEPLGRKLAPSSHQRLPLSSRRLTCAGLKPKGPGLAL